MSELALYRKYRPKEFKDVLGQEHVISVLQGAIAQGNISHAYLFCGSRGTGKTSIARIFAKAIGTSANDIYEIDAASNRGIDDVRALREGVNTLPFESVYKVYIIDEVHMLTKEAFNALLKTLEEPPKHAIFILATTEADRLPDTIVSRCQAFTFKKPTQIMLKALVLSVAKKEGYSLESASGELIALLGDGSFRDTLGILQKVIGSSSDKKLSTEEVLRVTGAPRREVVHAFLEAVDSRDSAKGIHAVSSAAKEGIDMKIFLTLVLQKMRFALLLRYAPDLQKMIEEESGEEDFVFLQGLAKKKESGVGSSALSVLLRAYDTIGRSFLPELPLELALIEIAEEGKSIS